MRGNDPDRAPSAEEPRQFVFTNAADFAMPGWRRRALPGGWTLHLHPATPVEILAADPGAPAIRLGHAFCVEPDGEGGAGRFALLRWPRLSPDAGGLLALYWGERAGGRRAVASSPRLAAVALDGRPRPLSGGAPLRHHAAFNYIPSPGAPFEGLRRLLHDQALDLAAFRIEHRPSPIRPLGGYEAALGVLAGELVRFAGEVAQRTPGRVFLPLTAGLDSRTLAAALLAAGARFETVTFAHAGKPPMDVAIARAVSERAGVRHHALRLKAPCPRTAARIAAHVAGAALGWDHTDVYPGGGYRYLGEGDVMLSGACFEIGRQRTRDTRFRGLDFENAQGADVWTRRTDAEPGPAFIGFLDEWIAWRRRRPLAMDFAAAFYLDQRIGGWRSALEHGYDLLPGTALCPANNARVYSALITPDAAAQRAGQLQRDVIAMLAPELLDIPVNPAPLRHRLGRMRRDLVRAVRTRLPGLPARPAAAGAAAVSAAAGAVSEALPHLLPPAAGAREG